MQSELDRIARKLAQCSTSSVDEQAILGFLVGALYALRRSVELQYSDRTGSNLPTDYGKSLTGVAAELGVGSTTNDRAWMATFYFNSAVLRLSAAGDRMIGLKVRARRRTGRGPVGRHNRTDPVRSDAEALKHPPGGLLKGRSVGLREATHRLEELTDTLLNALANKPLQPTSGGKIERN
jgi:hypothetical protein